MDKKKNSKAKFLKKKEMIFVFCVLPLLAGVTVILGMAWMEFGKSDKAAKKVAINEAAVIVEEQAVPLAGGPVTKRSSEASEETEGLGGNLVIEEEKITGEPLFYNYTSKNGVLIQLIFVRASDGSLCVGVNLSRECKDEPDAFFEPVDGKLRCVANGHTAEYEEIGILSSAPMGISYSTENGRITIKEAELKKFEYYFKNRQITSEVEASVE